MKNILIIILNLFLCASFSVAQKICNCRDYIDDVANMVERNYVDRASVKKKAYNDVIKKLRSSNLNVSYDTCILLIYSFMSKLKDSHISFFIERDSGTFMKTLYDSSTMGKIFDKYIKFSAKKESIEGVWENDNREVEYIIVKGNSPKTYNVIIWNSKISIYKRGQLKGTLIKANDNDFIYKSYGSTKLATAYKMTKQGDCLYSFITGNWRRQFLGSAPYKFDYMPSMVSLSKNTLLLKMPSFNLQYAPIIDSLIKSSNLRKTEHLIIDMRTNLGGSIQTYRSVLPFLYTNPIRIESGIYYSSYDNIQNLKGTLSRLSDTSNYYLAYKKLIGQLEKNPEKFVLDSGYYYVQDSVYEYPKRVSILVGKRCGSAGELFLISTLQSKKVILFGENSAGISDRLDAYSFFGSCKGLRMTIPISIRKPESYLKPIDNIGIPPHIKIPPGLDWINFVIKYTEKHN